MTATEPPPPRRRVGRPPLPHRKTEIVNAAAELFHARGFHSVGIADIGEAVGMTGPGVYRHFENKHAILVAIINRAGELIREGPAPSDAPAAERLRQAIEAYAALVIEHAELISVLLAERANLPPDAGEQVRRDMGRLVRTWTGLLAEARPDLSHAQTQAAINATFGLVNSVTGFRNRLGDAELRDLLVQMACAALKLPRKRGARGAAS